MHLGRKITVFIVFILIAVPIFNARQNYVGYCAEKGRILSDDEMIRLAIEDTISWMKISAKAKQENALYNDVDDFLSKTPDCCSFGLYAYGSEGLEYIPPFTDRIAGAFRGYVTLKYKLNYLNASGVEMQEVMQGNKYMSNCKVSHF